MRVDDIVIKKEAEALLCLCDFEASTVNVLSGTLEFQNSLTEKHIESILSSTEVLSV